MFYLKKYQLSLGDIEESFRQQYPANLQYKALERKAKCLQYLGRTTEAVKAYEDAITALTQSGLKPEEVSKKKSTFTTLLRNAKNTPVPEAEDHKNQKVSPCRNTAPKCQGFPLIQPEMESRQVKESSCDQITS